MTTRTARFALFFVAPLLMVSLAYAEISSRRKLPSETFKRYHVNGADYKAPLEACQAARLGTGWKAIRADKPNTGGGVNCLYEKAGQHGEQVGAMLVVRCPDNAAPHMPEGIKDENQRICVCVGDYVSNKKKADPKCVARVRSPDKICDDATYDKLSDTVDERKDAIVGGCPEKKERGAYKKFTCDQAKLNLTNMSALLASRQAFEQKCFETVDDGHQQQIDGHERGVKRCEAAVADKCTASGAK